MRLRECAHAQNLKTILITSALPQDGKTTVTMNLATALSERGKRAVLVIEGDLHRPCLGERLCVSTNSTLTECLQDHLNPMSAIERIEPLGWYFLSAGEPRKNATELLQSPALAGLLQKVSPYFDWILIDSPPVVSITDALLLQLHADASLLVVRAGQTPQATVEQAVQLLGRKKLLGVILNGVSRSKKNGYGYYYSKASSA
jgi:capsular exopolysaccharide synthesis family protein